MTPTIFQWIKESVDKRKKQKKEIDRDLNLSNEQSKVMNLSSTSFNESEPVRLIDEGALTYEEGDIRFYVQKGTVERFVNHLDDDYVGYINLGHLDVYAVPLILGYWKKEDLEIVDIGDGRKGLNCTPHLNKEMSIVKDLLAQDIPLSVSSEIQFEWNWDKTEKLGSLVTDEMFVLGFSIVGNPANTSSSDVSLSEGDNMDLKKIKELLGLTELSSEEKEEDKETVEETSKVEETKETEEKESKEEGESEESETSEEETTEPTEEGSTEETLSEEDLEKLDLLFADYKKVKEENKQLKEELASLKSQETKLSSSVKGTLGKFEQLLNAQVKPEKKEKSSDCPDFL